jgi:RNA recognition motif. (a.k.a. RRM, RBD, or RNP domain)
LSLAHSLHQLLWNPPDYLKQHSSFSKNNKEVIRNFFGGRAPLRRGGPANRFGLLPTIPEKGHLLMPVRLFVGNLSEETTSTEIRDLFSAVGEVESCNLIADKETGRLKGFGFVEMNSREAANAVKEKFNGHSLHGKSLKVDEAKPRT